MKLSDRIKSQSWKINIESKQMVNRKKEKKKKSLKVTERCVKKEEEIHFYA